MSNLSPTPAGQLLSPQELFRGVTIRPNRSSQPIQQHPQVQSQPQMARDSVQVPDTPTAPPAVGVQFSPPAAESAPAAAPPATPEAPAEQRPEAQAEPQSPTVEQPDPALEQREADLAWARALENKIMNGERPSQSEMERYNRIQWADVRNPLER